MMTWPNAVILSFDVDGTLDISGGPIPSKRLFQLKEHPFIVVGFNGNAKLAKAKLGDKFDFYHTEKMEALKMLNKKYPNALLKIHIDDVEAFREPCKRLGWIYIHPKDFI